MRFFADQIEKGEFKIKRRVEIQLALDAKVVTESRHANTVVMMRAADWALLEPDAAAALCLRSEQGKELHRGGGPLPGERLPYS